MRRDMTIPAALALHAVRNLEERADELTPEEKTDAEIRVAIIKPLLQRPDAFIQAQARACDAFGFPELHANTVLTSIAIGEFTP